ncbi:cubilin [Hyalella azteca]|uniref:Cubilin n=1 Tax=Hyalella azteca TaxID=294128 RepID=A0A8B7P4B5_HYAAZ|nr:cubilin [Hyalella azteca]
MAISGKQKCPGDFLGVSKRGDKQYQKPKLNNLCGTSLPKSIRSEANKLNILFNGKLGGSGFELHYNVCDLASGDQGTIQELNYAPNTFCEWWLTAPAGCKIILEFVSFDVGVAGGSSSPKCPGDYLGLSRRGDQLYKKPMARPLCGTSLPRKIRSVANKLNILLNDRDGGNGFQLKYNSFILHE